jgi:phage terminase large subunit-like protein
MGDSVDWFHIDEEPRDADIFPQVLTRTATGDKGRGGRGILTFTPENGRTELVIQFMDTPSPAQKYMQKGWDDAPHLSEKVKEGLLASFPAHQRDMRTKGVPMLGHGRIYDLAEDDHLPAVRDPAALGVIDGMDFGWDHPQAHVQLVWDREGDMFYVTRRRGRRADQADRGLGRGQGWAEGRAHRLAARRPADRERQREAAEEVLRRSRLQRCWPSTRPGRTAATASRPACSRSAT